MHAAGFMSAAYTALKLHNDVGDDDCDVRCGFFSARLPLLLFLLLLLLLLELQSDKKNQKSLCFLFRSGSCLVCSNFIFFSIIIEWGLLTASVQGIWDTLAESGSKTTGCVAAGDTMKIADSNWFGA